ncbi:MAG: RecQ family ATP-dependent DNA helicase, partial [Chitinophagaceae bacterium]
MKRPNAEILLKKTFNLANFYDEQWETISKILNGERVLLIEKTGFGKSLCYQFPATIFDGLTVIFSPLIALMRDQVKKLNALGIQARCINSEQTPEENNQIIEDAKHGKLKILYIAPERQESAAWIDATQEMKLSMVVIDEAHCISVWGHDFRPAFKRIINLVNLLPQGMPVLATTATATKRVEGDIMQQIGNGVQVIRGSLMRDNFSLFVLKVSNEDEKLIWLGQNLDKLPGSGIIYTGTRSNTEIYSNYLTWLGIPVSNYNAGLNAESRIQVEDGLIANKWKAIVSTNALGMGIDKPDIRFVIHTQMPQSPIHYYQEIGRAGRDGNPSTIILLFNPNEDVKLPRAFIEAGKPSIDKYNKVINALKAQMLGERDLQKKTNLTQTPIRVIKAGLIEQKIIREIAGKKYEYVMNAPALNTKSFEALRNDKLKELESMIEYVETKQSRMNFLCEYLGDAPNASFTNCDNT